MNKLIITFFLSAFICIGGMAQKYCSVDTKYILEHMQEYLDAQDELDNTAAQWQKEIEDKYATIDRLERSYRAESVLLTEEMKTTREAEIERQKQEVRKLQQQRFGVEGDLFKKRQQLIQPIQQQIYDAIREYAVEGGYMFVFDKSGQSNILYVNTKYDKSDKILRKLGLRPGDKPEKKGTEENSSTEESKTNNIDRGGGSSRTDDSRK